MATLSFPSASLAMQTDPALKSYASVLLKAVLGSCLLAVSARASIPIGPVPLTLQTVALAYIGMLLGPKAATTAVALYLLEGILGLPVFSAGRSGLACLMGPTGGYLVGFLFSVILFAYVDKLEVPVARLLLLITAPLTTLAVGSLWLSCFAPFNLAFTSGFLVFIPIELTKISMSYLFISSLKQGSFLVKRKDRA